MDYTEHKRKTLAHCLWMAQQDTHYAIWAAREYERTMPWLLTNLARVVEAHIAKSRLSAPAAGSPISGSGSVKA